MDAVTIAIVGIIVAVVAVAITLAISNSYHKAQSRKKIGSAAL